MLDLTIEPMQVEHIDRVAAIEKLVYPSPWSRSAFVGEILENSFAVYFVALLDDVLVGYAGLWIILDEAHITNLAVHPDFHGHHLGSTLLRHLILEAGKRGAVRMTLEVRVSNKKAQKLYAKYGFVCRGIRKNYYSDEDAMIMWLDDFEPEYGQRVTERQK